MKPTRPIYLCVLPPGASLTVPYAEPLSDAEEPVVLGRPGELVVSKPAPNQVVVRNTTDRTVGGQLVVMPASAVRLMRLPWKQVVEQTEGEIRTFLKGLGFWTS